MKWPFPFLPANSDWGQIWNQKAECHIVLLCLSSNLRNVKSGSKPDRGGGSTFLVRAKTWVFFSNLVHVTDKKENQKDEPFHMLETSHENPGNLSVNLTEALEYQIHILRVASIFSSPFLVYQVLLILSCIFTIPSLDQNVYQNFHKCIHISWSKSEWGGMKRKEGRIPKR